MSSTIVERIESDIQQLSLPDQLLLMERLARTIRQHTSDASAERNDQLAAMADDPDIQRELRLIEAEFKFTEADGLDEAA